ncbi:hypothetical protein B9Z55_012654 [Caenorhabditis nigoni]|uniref:DUF38 domain-containing protein n=1 Tax=Caenorhabditis nigoni TaxID=1611254 RepID=A0A2G5TYD4_9PELO|nr:hypothetical protein B9Z55_012654 [Caenorhabditis nigoni]
MDGCYYKVEFVEKETENFLQLTVKHRDREYVERVQNKERTLFFFSHYINKLLLGGRSEPLRVKRLEINVNFMCIPSSVKYHTKEVDFGVNRGFEIDILKKIVDASSLPLNFYAFGYFSEYWTIPEHPEFRSARSVLIRNEDDNQPDLFRHILELPNKNITVQSRLSWITFQTIIDNWKTTQRKVGTSLTIERVHTQDVENILNQILGQMQYRENENGTSINDVDYQIDMIYEDLKPFLQLTVKHQYREYVEKVRDKTSFLDPRRCINHFLFGGRSGIIRVKHLQINVDISRLTEFVKFQSKEVDSRITTADGFEQLKKIMDASSFPLDYCGIEIINNDWSTLEHPVFRTACCVFIRNEESNQAELFRRILELPQGNITVQSRLTWITFQMIIDNWKRTQRKVGTSLTIDSVHTAEIEEILNQILEQRQYRENKNGDFIIPLYEDKNLIISYGDTHEELPKNPTLWNNFTNFLKLEVIDVESE